MFLRYRRHLLLVTLCLLVFGIFSLGKIKTDANYRVYFDIQSPLLKTEALFKDTFAVNESLIIVLHTDQQQPLLRIGGLKTSSLQVKQRVETLFDVRQSGGFHQLFATEDQIEVTEQQKSLYQQAYLSNAGDSAVMQFDIKLAEDMPPAWISQQLSHLNQQLEKSLKPLGIKYYLAGTIALNAAYIDVVKHDIVFFLPGLLLLMAAMLFMVYRQAAIVGLLLINGLLATVVAAGLAATVGLSYTAINAFTPVIIIGLSITSSLHLVHGFIHNMSEGLSVNEALQKTMQFNAVPFSLSCLSTAIGFLFLLLSPSPPVQLVGVCVAIGVLVSFLLSCTLLSYLLQQSRLDQQQAQSVINRCHNISRHFKRLSQKKGVIIILVALGLGAAAALTKLEINDNIYKYFPPSHSFVKAIHILNDDFVGVSRLEYTLLAKQGDFISNEAALYDVLAFSEWLNEQSLVRQVVRLPLEQLNQKQRNWLFSQFFAPDINGQLYADAQGSKLRLSVLLPALSAKEMLSLNRQIQQWLDKNSEHLNYNGGISPDLILAQLGKLNAQSMFVCLIAALFLIALFIGIGLRSKRYLLYALICNLLPLLISFGLWAFVGGYISLGSAIVVGMMMGIIVDDTLHILYKFNHFQEQNLLAVDQLWREVNPVIGVSSIVLMAALSVGLFSSFRPIYELALLSICTLFFAVLVDLLLLPYLLSKTKNSVLTADRTC